MKFSVRLLSVVVVFAFAVSFSQAEPRQIIQGTQIHLKLLSDISTSTARNGDGFIAVTTEPVMLGGDTLLPAGTRIRGIVTSINHARHFALLRGEAYMNISFRSVEVDSRLIPIQLSVLQIEKPSAERRRTSPQGRRHYRRADASGKARHQGRYHCRNHRHWRFDGDRKTRQPRRRRIWNWPRGQRDLCISTQGQGSHTSRRDGHAGSHGQHRHRSRRQRFDRFRKRQQITERATSSGSSRWPSLLRSVWCGVHCALQSAARIRKRPTYYRLRDHRLRGLVSSVVFFKKSSVVARLSMKCLIEPSGEP